MCPRPKGVDSLPASSGTTSLNYVVGSDSVTHCQNYEGLGQDDGHPRRELREACQKLDDVSWKKTSIMLPFKRTHPT